MSLKESSGSVIRQELIPATIGMCRMKVIRQNHISDGYSEEKYILIKILRWRVAVLLAWLPVIFVQDAYVRLYVKFVKNVP